MDINSNTVGIVVPTLGSRAELLEITLRSIKDSRDVYTLIVCPNDVDLSSLEYLFDQRVVDPGTGLANAINFGFRSLPDEIKLINWLGDDDYLEPKSIDQIRDLVNSDSKVVAAFGKCCYVDEHGNELFTNHSGRWAIPLLHFGPDLIPQPGMLFKREAFNSVGELSQDFGWAFDFDLLLKLKKIGKIKYLNKKVANFRWHRGSLSVGQRSNSVLEASRVRISHLPKFLKPISFIWEKPVMYLTLKTGERLSRKMLEVNR